MLTAPFCRLYSHFASNYSNLVFPFGIPSWYSHTMGTLKLQQVGRKHARGSHEIVSLDNVSLSIEPGSYVTITGPSGSGKSTMLQLLGLLDRPTSGTVLLDDVDTVGLTEDERAVLRRKEYGFVFQSFHLMPGLTAWENVAMPLVLDGRKLAVCKEQAVALLADVELADRSDHRPADLSGGEQQRVAIARSLIAEPAVVLADEPTGALDQTTSGMVIALLEKLTVGKGRSLILVTHDATIAGRHGARQIGLRDGCIAFDHQPVANK
jgi:putative ABC transport system ATP-binding protein